MGFGRAIMMRAISGAAEMLVRAQSCIAGYGMIGLDGAGCQKCVLLPRSGTGDKATGKKKKKRPRLDARPFEVGR
jgi:hypothetical protein